ncbi:uncharacterized protein LOC133898643 [Phragmites australis]|uniref:uncharacterized protein LOC133898643 n=1 Tax=Phragmites australis TaxID=29695 RepID=UPI002D79383B|nr:uncharacterized protein LOC133898643 [Phragmites australis]
MLPEFIGTPRPTRPHPRNSMRSPSSIKPPLQRAAAPSLHLAETRVPLLPPPSSPNAIRRTRSSPSHLRLSSASPKLVESISQLAAGVAVSPNAGKTRRHLAVDSVNRSFPQSINPLSGTTCSPESFPWKNPLCVIALGDEQCASLQDQAFENFEQPAFEVRANKDGASRKAAPAVGEAAGSVRLPDGVSGDAISVESLLNTGRLQSFVPVGSGPGPGPGPSTFTCTLRLIGLLGFEVALVLDLRVNPASTGCTVEMLSCRFVGSESVEQQNELFSGYPTFRGQVLNGNQLWDLIEGLEENDLIHYTHLLTVCDPVLCDEGTLYVSQELISVYQQKADASLTGQACSHAGGAAAERLPFLGSAAA